MKKIGLVVALGFAVAISALAQDYNTTLVEKDLVLPDGSKGDVSFFKKWGDASKMANNKSWAPRHTTDKVQTESEFGLADIWHEENENQAIQKICDLMKSSNSSYGVSFVNHDKRIRRLVLTYKDGRLRNSFVDFFDETHPTYVAYIKAKEEKQEKLNSIATGFAKGMLKSAGATVSDSGTSSSQDLYSLRHRTYEVSRIGPHGNNVTFQYRFIYRDNGSKVSGYIVDLNGNIRAEGNGIAKTQADIEKIYPVIDYYSVPKDLRALAKKSLE